LILKKSIQLYGISCMHFIIIVFTKIIDSAYHILNPKRDIVIITGGLSSFFPLSTGKPFLMIKIYPLFQFISSFCNISVRPLGKKIRGIYIGSPGIPDFSDQFKSAKRASKAGSFITNFVINDI